MRNDLIFTERHEIHKKTWFFKKIIILVAPAVVVQLD